MNWHTRLAQARTAKGLRKNAFAKLVGVSAPTITQWENGETKKIEGTNLMKVCAVLEITPEWLMNDEGPKRDVAPGFSPVTYSSPDDSRFYNIRKFAMLRLSAGVAGVQLNDDENEVSTMGIDRAWADRHGYHESQLVAIEVRGESMEPSLYAGDTVVVNTADTRPVDGAVFAINYEGEALVKRLARDAGDWWLTSDNPDQRRFHRKVCRGDGCLIVGRIVRKESDRI
jgi:phage repressor protein C with HTH and peptisase S24 domain